MYIENLAVDKTQCPLFVNVFGGGVHPFLSSALPFLLIVFTCYFSREWGSYIAQATWFCLHYQYFSEVALLPTSAGDR